MLVARQQRLRESAMSESAKPDSNACGESRAARLVVVIVGIDHYRSAGVPDLFCSVNDAESLFQAFRHTQPAGHVHLALLTSPAREKEVKDPSRENILAALARAAEVAGENDTIIFYFAGHGVFVDGRACLAPADAGHSAETGSWGADSLMGLDEVQAVFENRPARRRIMFLDCCQSGGDRGGTPSDNLSGAAAAGSGSGGSPGLSTELISRLRQQSRGWSIVFSCGPNEVSLEDAARANHGLFSLFLATGLRGAADLNGDGVVSLAELIQYLADRVPKQAEAVIKALGKNAPSVVPPGQGRQNVTVIWDGPIDTALTPSVDEGRAGFQLGVLGLWRRQLFRPLPYLIHVQGMFRYGVAFLYGCVMALTVLLYAFGGPLANWSWFAVGVGAASALAWNAVFALASAANQRRWHAGGYLTAEILLAWHVIVFGGWWVYGRWLAGGETAAMAVFPVAVNLFVLISLMVIFGVNAAQFIIALADLFRRDERVTLWRIFVQLDEKWIHAEIPNNIAMVSGHPRLYQLVGGICCALAVAHSAYLLIAYPFSTSTAIAIARDATLIVLIQWQVQWIAASYRKIYNDLVPAK
jgi:uncharacterized caspase-like protein